MPEGTTFGLIGENGSGKSTLLKCIARILRPDAGSIDARRQDLGAARARRRLPPRAVGPRERLPQRRDPRPVEEAARRALRRDRRVRRPRAVHRHAGEELLVGHVRAPRLLGRDQRRSRHPAGRRGARGRRRGSSSASARRSSPSCKESGKTIVIVSHALGIDAHAVRRGGAARARQRSSRSARRARSIDTYLGDVHDDRVADGEHGSRWGSGEGRDRATSSCSTPTGQPYPAHRRRGDVPAPLRASTSRSTKPVFAFAIHTLDGMHVTAPEHPRAGVRPRPHRRRRATSTSASTALLLVPGTYDVSASLFDYALHAHVRLPAPVVPLRRRARRTRGDVAASCRSAARGTVSTSAGCRDVTDAGRAAAQVVRSSSSTTGAPTTRSPASRAPRAFDWPADTLEVDRRRQRLGRRQRRADPGGRTRASTLIESTTNTGFAGGCNLGAAAATGRVPRVHQQRRPPRPAVARRRRSTCSSATPDVACVASKVLDWDGERDRLRRRRARPSTGTGSSCTSAMPDDARRRRRSRRAVRVRRGDGRRCRRCSARVGGFDERLLHVLRGRRPRLAALAARLPGALRARRRSSSTGTTRRWTRSASWREHYLLERNALFTIYKNYDDENLRAVSARGARCSQSAGASRWAATTRTCSTSVERTVGDDEPRDRVAQGDARRCVRGRRLRRAARRSARTPARAPASAPAPRRTRSCRCSGMPLHRELEPAALRRPGFDRWSERLRTSRSASVRRRADPRRHRRHARAGDGRARDPCLADRPGALARARRAAREHDDVRGPRAPRLRGSQGRRARQLRRAGRLVRRLRLPGLHHARAPVDRRARARSSSPTSTTRSTSSSSSRRAISAEAAVATWCARATDVLNEQLARGDFFLCASDKQRDFWLGQLAAVGRINPVTYDDGREPRAT